MSGYDLVISDLLDRAGDWQEAEAAMASARSSLAGLGSECFSPEVAAGVQAWLDAWVDHATTLRDEVDRAGYTLEQNALTYRAGDEGVATGFRPGGAR